MNVLVHSGASPRPAPMESHPQKDRPDQSTSVDWPQTKACPVTPAIYLAIFASLVVGAEPAADDAFLHPNLARQQVTLGREAGQLGAGSRAARRAVVGPAGAEHEIPAMRPLRIGPVQKTRYGQSAAPSRSGNASARQALPLWRMRRCQCRSVPAIQRAGQRQPAEKTSCRPTRRRHDHPQSRHIEAHAFMQAVACDIFNRRRMAIREHDRDNAHRRFNPVQAEADPAEMRRGSRPSRSCRGRTCRGSLHC